ncbi:hypothetical protein D6_0246 [Aeromonas phage D6]|uniref:Uncharacterized protein n=1 Tax=Aeromonas phage D6 TaxID=2593322 RepID=A0A514TWK8_9CAUD|nr:hypothetical protein PQC08_gp029 [Aeromonas phage D6]QDJ97405.1 hypothetical protein D6_0246 [Aeromonas phage D6]
MTDDNLPRYIPLDYIGKIRSRVKKHDAARLKAMYERARNVVKNNTQSK